MTHARQQIREAVATALTGLTTTGTRVYQSRMTPKDTQPFLLIETGHEEIEQGPQLCLQRALIVTVRGYAKAASNVDDALDTIAAEIEVAAQAAGTFGGKLPAGLVLQSIDVDFDDALERPVGVIEMQFKAGYFTQSGLPGSFV